MGAQEKLATVVFPGLDGGTELLNSFVRVAPREFDVRPQRLPSSLSDYRELAAHFAPLIDETDRCAIVAESFSGPLAVQLAAALGKRVKLLVLAASFVSSPRPWLIRALPWRWLLRMPLPDFVARQAMLGADANAAQVAALREAIRRTDRRMLGERLREISRTNVADCWRQVACPTLYLRASRDVLIPARCISELVAARPDVEIQTIDGGHLLLATRPGECWREIARFAARHDPAF